MKNLNTYFAGALLVLNILAGLIISSYNIFNVVLTSIVLIIAIALYIKLNKSEILSSYKISLSFILPTITLVELVLGIFAKSEFTDNWFVMAIALLIIVQVMLIMAVKKISTKKSNSTIR